MACRVGLGERTPQPGVDELVDDAAGLLPAATRRQLGERRRDPGQVGQRVGRDIGEGLGEHLAEPLDRQRAIGQRRAQSHGELVDVDVHRRPHHLADLALALVDRPGELAQHQRVVGDQQVHRAAHRQQPHQRPVLEAARDVVRVEGLEPRREPEVRRLVVLRLEADEVLTIAGTDESVRANRCWRSSRVRLSTWAESCTRGN